MQGPVRFHHRKFFRRSPDTTLRHARAGRPCATTRRTADGPRRLGPDVPGPDRRRGTGGAAVNLPTFNRTRPAAATRTGQGSGAPPVRNSLPFAALPHQLRKDPRLKRHRTAVVLAAALLEYARDSPHCWPSNRRLAEDLGVCQQTVRNALAALQAAGCCRVEHGAGNPTGRLIWLCWRATPERATPSNRLDHPLQPVGGTPLKLVGPEVRSVIVEP